MSTIESLTPTPRTDTENFVPTILTTPLEKLIAELERHLLNLHYQEDILRTELQQAALTNDAYEIAQAEACVKRNRALQDGIAYSINAARAIQEGF